MKKIFCVVLALVAVLSLSLVTFAHPLTPVQPEKEVVIEIEKEEDFFQYPCDPNYKYTFIWQLPQKARTICYKCGKPYLGLAQIREQSTTYTVGCPDNGLSPDVFSTWNNYSVERCTYCHMQNIISKLPDTYSAYCTEMGDTWEVRKEWTLANGHQLHECYDYWINPDKYRH